MKYPTCLIYQYNSLLLYVKSILQLILFIFFFLGPKDFSAQISECGVNGSDELSSSSDLIEPEGCYDPDQASIPDYSLNGYAKNVFV